MRRVAVYAIIVLVVATSAYAASELLRSLLTVDVSGVVEVPNAGLSTSGLSIDVKLNITVEEGEEIFDLGLINLPSGPILVKRELVSSEGNLTLVLSGVLSLESEDVEYTIPMPCLLSLGEPCYRVLVLIPGYDTPLEVVEGRYRAVLRLQWVARGTGRFHLRLVLTYLGTSIEVLGAKPDSTDDWLLASNSTRTYSMFVKRVFPDRVLAYLWVHDPESQTSGKVTFVLKVRGVPVAVAEVQTFREGQYWKILAGASLEPWLSYSIHAYLDSSIELVAEV